MTSPHVHLSDSLAQQRPENSTLLIATVWIINHLYARHSISVTFSLWSSTAADDRLQTELLSEILTSVRGTKLTFVIENSQDVQCGTDDTQIVFGTDDETNECLLRKGVILMVDSFEAFMRFKRQLNRRNFLIAGHYSILYTGYNRAYYDDISSIFAELFAIYVINVNIFVELPTETLVYSYFPFTQYQCHDVTPVVYNRFTAKDGYVFSKPFFPRKANNFYGCRLTLASWNGPPFFYFKPNPHGEPFYRGIEGALIRLLATKMNFTVKLLDAKMRGRVLRNLTTTVGAIKLVVDGKANITINTFVYSTLTVKVMLPSYTYTSYPVIVAVPQGRALSPFQRLTRPFKYIIWSCLSSSVLAAITIIFAIKCLQKKIVSDFVFGPFNKTPFTNLLNIIFGGPLTVMPARNFARYILFVWLFYTLIMRSAYTGELYIMLQDSSSRTNLQSFNELIERNFTLMCTDNTLEILYRSTRARRLEIIEGQPFRYLAQLRDSDANLAVVVLRPFLRLYNRVMRAKSPIKALRDPLVTIPQTMYFRKNSYLLPAFNEHLMKFMSAGMFYIWDRFYLPNEDVMEENTGGEPTVLSVQLLMGLFSVYLFLLGVSILQFAMEIWSLRSPICRCVADFINF